MIPSSTSPIPRDGDETAMSLPAPRRPLDPTLPDADGPTTEASQTDATVVRDAPSASTVTISEKGENFGKYELLGEVARGGMGVVYRARQHGLDRLVALKMILGTGVDHETAERFLQEARAAAAIDHPNVVPIYDIGEIGGKPYFTMALIDGPNLRGHVEAHGRLAIPQVVSLFVQTVAGVAHAHKLGIIHRDLKPANVLIDRDGRPRVTDFGLAKRFATDSQLTATGQVVGTPSYMAPEQARDSKEVGPPADVYALGAVLYFMLTGRPPFTGEGVTDLLIKVVMEAPVPPRELNPEVPADLEALCLRCLAKSPADRFPDAQALAAALAPIADQYLAPSANLTPSTAQVAMPRTPSTGSATTVPDVSGSASVPSLSRAFPASAPAAPASAPVSVTNRRPLVIALCAVAALLVGAIGYLASRDKKKDDTAGPTPAQPGDPNRGAVAGEADKFAWPRPQHADFALKVALVAPAAQKDREGLIRLTAGTPLEVHLTADRDCRVSVWWLAPSGQEMRLFPNEYEDDDRLKAGVERVVPGKATYEIGTTPTEGAGPERLRVFATTGERPAFPPGVKKQQYAVYATPAEREQLASTVRGLVLKKTDASAAPVGAMSEVEVLFRVTK